MQVHQFCCLTCSKSVGEHNAPFRRMRLGLLQPRDLITLAVHKSDLFGFSDKTTWEVREKKKRELFDAFEQILPLEASERPKEALPRSMLEIENEAAVFGRLVKNGATYYIENAPIALDAPTAYSVLGIVRRCCKERACGPPIWPLFAGDRPEGATIRHDTGLRRRVVYRAQGTDGYFVSNVSKRAVDSTVAPTVDAEIEQLDF